MGGNHRRRRSWKREIKIAEGTIPTRKNEKKKKKIFNKKKNHQISMLKNSPAVLQARRETFRRTNWERRPSGVDHSFLKSPEG